MADTCIQKYGALFLNGLSSYGYVADNTNHDIGTGDFSASFWMRTSRNAGNSRAFLCKSRNASENYRWYFLSTATTFSFVIIFSGTSVRQVDVNYSVLNDWIWHLVTGTVDRDGYMRLYVDGAEVGVAVDISDKVANNVNNADATMIGAYQSATGGVPPAGYYATLLMDDIAIWKGRALAATDVADLWNGGAGLKIVPTNTFPTSGVSMGSSLVSLYTCDEMTGTTLADSVSGINMTLVNTTDADFQTGIISFDIAPTWTTTTGIQTLTADANGTLAAAWGSAADTHGGTIKYRIYIRAGSAPDAFGIASAYYLGETVDTSFIIAQDAAGSALAGGTAYYVIVRAVTALSTEDANTAVLSVAAAAGGCPSIRGHRLH
jgi:hypothetical protein